MISIGANWVTFTYPDTQDRISYPLSRIVSIKEHVRQADGGAVLVDVVGSTNYYVLNAVDIAEIKTALAIP